MDELITPQPSDDGDQGQSPEPNDAPRAESTPTEPVPGLGAEPTAPLPSGPMPLSMPPFAPPDTTAEQPVAPLAPAMSPHSGGGTLPPPPPPGNSWAFAAPYEPPTPDEPPTPAPLGWPVSEPGPGTTKASTKTSSSRRGLAVFLGAALLAAGLGAGLGVGLSSSSPASSSGPLADTGGSSSTATLPTSTAPLAKASSVAAISKAVTPAVVDIATNVATAEGTEQAAGTGMIISPSGEVLTNNHVVEGATSIKVTIQGRKGSYGATVLGVDVSKDVALLQLQGVSGLPYVSLGNSSKVTIGSSVVAIGNALGLGGAPTVTSGAVTALDRSISAEDEGDNIVEPLSGLIETDAEIQPGDSGGPLVNSSGQVVGMDTAAASSDGGPSIGFAIPINEAKAIVSAIEEHKTTGGILLGLSSFLGVEVAPANEATSSPGGNFGGFGISINGLGNGSGLNNSGTSTPSSGQFVEGLVPNGPAETAGIVAGDTITSIDGTAVTNSESSLTSALAKLKPGAKVSVGVVNSSGASETLTVELGAIPK